MTSPPAAVFTVYTDGACAGNPGPGGWAWATAPDGALHDSGGEKPSTNQRMEIRAVLEALCSLDGQLTIVTDSTYVKNGCETWWKKWKANGWKNSQRQPVANLDLWQPLIELVIARQPKFKWVKGHSGDPMNDLVDALAVAASNGPFTPRTPVLTDVEAPQGSLFDP
jgi:ribonuclease HI